MKSDKFTVALENDSLTQSGEFCSTFHEYNFPKCDIGNIIPKPQICLYTPRTGFMKHLKIAVSSLFTVGTSILPL